jgi:hypothetical protein
MCYPCMQYTTGDHANGIYYMIYIFQQVQSRSCVLRSHPLTVIGQSYASQRAFPGACIGQCKRECGTRKLHDNVSAACLVLAARKLGRNNQWLLMTPDQRLCHVESPPPPPPPHTRTLLSACRHEKQCSRCANDFVSTAPMTL